MLHSTDGSKTLTVANMAQKVIFLCEMQGQLSDGNWENASPSDHWKVWCKLDWDSVIVDPDNVGRNFTAYRDNYNFANKELLDIVGERIMLKINLLQVMGDVALEVLMTNHWAIPDDESSYKTVLWGAAKGDEYWVNKKAQLDEIGLTPELFAKVVQHGSYNRTDLNRDCKVLKIVCRTRTS